MTLVDAVHGLETLKAHEEARHQVAVADRLLLTKVDMADAATLSRLKAQLATLAPGLEPLIAAELEPVAVIDCSALDIGARAAEAMQHHHTHEHHHHGHDHHDHDHDHDHAHSAAFDTILLTHDRPIGGAALEGFLDLLRSQCGAQILRLKGLVELVENPERPLVVQGVRQVLHEPRWLPAWPDETRGVPLWARQGWIRPTGPRWKTTLSPSPVSGADRRGRPPVLHQTLLVPCGAEDGMR